MDLKGSANPTERLPASDSMLKTESWSRKRWKWPMYYPLVGERVWVSGCRDEFTVVGTDYSTDRAAIALSSDRAIVQEGVAFRLLFAYEEFAAAQAGVAGPQQVLSVLRTSHACSLDAKTHIFEARELVRTTLTAIEKSLALISESDRAIARWQVLNCKGDGAGV